MLTCLSEEEIFNIKQIYQRKVVKDIWYITQTMFYWHCSVSQLNVWHILYLLYIAKWDANYSSNAILLLVLLGHISRPFLFSFTVTHLLELFALLQVASLTVYINNTLAFPASVTEVAPSPGFDRQHHRARVISHEPSKISHNVIQSKLNVC